MEPAPLLPGLGNTVRTAAQNPSAPSPTARTGARIPTAPTTAEQVCPRLGRLTVSVIKRDQLLRTVGTGPDHDQQAHLVLLETDLEEDPVDLHIHIVRAGQDRWLNVRASACQSLVSRVIVAGDNP